MLKVRAARRGRGADRHPGQLHRGASSSTSKRLWFFAGAVRVAGAVHHPRRRDGPARRLGRRRQLRAQRRRLPPARSTRRRCRSRSPRRIAISILNESFATHPGRGLLRRHVQHGAVRRQGRGLLRPRRRSASQGHIGFDALFQFSPFYFIIDDLGLARRSRSSASGCSASASAASSRAPTPWHIEGAGSISLLFFDIDVDFEPHLGRAARTRRCRRSRSCRCWRPSSTRSTNWTAELPTGTNLLRVAARRSRRPSDLVLHPLGALRVSQRASRSTSSSTRSATSGRPTPSGSRSTLPTTRLDKRADAKESFATAQFKDLSDADKLSPPAFEKQNGGPRAGGRRSRTIAVEPRVKRVGALRGDHHRQQLQAATCGASSALRSRPVHPLPGRQRRQPLAAVGGDEAADRRRSTRRSAITEPAYVVASSVDNTAYGDDGDVHQPRARRRRTTWPTRGRGTIPALARATLHVHPRRRGAAGGMSRAHRRPTRSCRGCVGARQPDQTGRPRHLGHAACLGRCRADAEGTGGRGRRRPPSRSPHVELYGPGDMVGIEPRADHPQRAAATGSPTSSPTTSPTSSSTTRTSPGATRRRHPTGGTAAALARAGRAHRGGVRGRRQPARPAAAVHRDHGQPDGGRLPARRPAVGLGPRARQQEPDRHRLRHLRRPTSIAVLAELDAAAGTEADLAYSRLLCPRKLAPNTGYHAFLVPTFETGRLAGLGMDPADAPNTPPPRRGDPTATCRR